MTTSTNKAARLMANNYCDDAATTMTYSSQLAAYPMSNVLNSARSRVGKFAGNFTIVSTNKKLYINDGADKTITLTEASYSGGAALASHIQTQLNASSTNWTCTYSTTTGKFTIGRSAGTAILRFTQTTDAAWDTLGYTGVADTSAGTGLAADEQRNHTEEWVKFDFLTPRAVEFVAAVAQIDRAFALSSQATVKLQLNSVDSWASPAAEVTLTRHDRGVMRFLDDVATSTYRYARIYIRDRLGSQGPEGISIGRVWLGDYDTFTTTSVGPGFAKAWVDPSRLTEADSGAIFSQLRTKYRTFSDIGIGQIEASERRAMEDLFEQVGVTEPFFLSIDPTLALSEELQEMTAYVRFDGSPKFTHLWRDYFSMSCAFREAV